MMTSEAPSIRVGLERFLKTGAQVWRDGKGRAVLAELAALDRARMRAEQVPLLELGSVVRVLSSDLSREVGAYVIPIEMVAISARDPAPVDKVELPLGKVESQHGLWLKLEPGLEEVGVNDRLEVVLRQVPERASDPTVGPVRSSANTIIAGRADRLVTRTRAAEAGADAEEARRWLAALEIADGRPTLESRFACAGIRYAQRGNVPYLYRTSQLNFFAPDDPGMKAIAEEVAARFRKIGRARVPEVEILSLAGLPRSQEEHRDLLARVRDRGGDPAKLGLPAEVAASRFCDPKAKGIVSSNFVHFAPLSEIPDVLRIITINTDYHGEVKSRGVLSPLMAIMSLVGVISAHAGAAVLTRRGTATTFTGPTGTGKTTACSFFSELNEGYRRDELKRRYRKDLGSEAAADEAMAIVGTLCQEDWIEIEPRESPSPGPSPRGGEGEGRGGGRPAWVFWPTERTMYARTGGFPGLRFILAENDPLVENACADFGGGGDPWLLGRVTHDYFPERLFYDPDWGHLKYDRSVRQVGANVFLERNKALSFIVKKVEPEEAIRWLLIGRTPQGKFEPLYNAYPDFSGLLMAKKVVGEDLVRAYGAAEREGRFDAIGGGDEAVGRAIFEKLDIQVKLWRKHCTEVPTYIVNGGPGLEITQDANWLLSEYPEVLDAEKELSVERFKQLMKERYGVTYGPKGEWTHFERPPRRR